MLPLLNLRSQLRSARFQRQISFGQFARQAADPQVCRYATDNFAVLKRFDDVVHAAGLEARDNTVGFIAGGDEEHRNVPGRRVLLEPPARFQSVQFRHHYVKQNNVRFGAGGDLEGGCPAGRRQDFIPFRFQCRRQNAKVLGHIIDQQYLFA